MRVLFGSWKYVFKNFWFVLPLALVPAVFLSLSLDYASIGALLRTFFSEEPVLTFPLVFRALSLVRGDTVLGGVFGACALLSVSLFAAILLCLTEKHMRIGKRTPSGAFRAFPSMLLSVFCIVVLYLALYELWCVVISAIVYAFGVIVKAAAGVRIFTVLWLALFTFVLLYLTTVFYLWLPCMQITGFTAYEAFRYSYQLLVGVRWKLILGYLLSLLPYFAFVAVGACFFSEAWFRTVMVLVFLLIFSDFFVRMETVYFKTDKIDREDILQTYKKRKRIS